MQKLENYHWQKASDINRDYPTYELLDGADVLFDMGYSDDKVLEVAFTSDGSGKVIEFAVLLQLLEKGKALASLDI
jgi:hypothetical protein